jgi:SAM-dependent methyltransferase
MGNDSFAADWLALREPVDHRSRPDGLLASLDAWLGARGSARVLDLGSGTGSNLRYLAPRLTTAQHWTLVDRDAALLARSPDAAAARVAGLESIERVQGDLAREGLDAIRGADLVTASALLDLVSTAWLDQLVDACTGSGCAALFALTWDGEIAWSTQDVGSDPDDALVLEAVRAHQRRDKGLGPALGSTAATAAERAFRTAGLRTWMMPSPWRLGPSDAELVRALVDGWESAAAEQRPRQAPRIRAWSERRRRATRAETLGLVVGHLDLLALPAEGP